MNVKNHAVIRRLSVKTLLSSRKRNLIAIAAITLTTLLFTSLFTIALSINDGFQQSNFRQVGTNAHGEFKRLTKEQFLTLREDSLIKQWGLRRFVGMPTEAPFNKSHVEISYCNANTAHWMFCDPIEGRLPKEGTDEAATDLRVLELLGVTPKLGTPFTVTFDVDGRETTQTFTLCGFWEYDPVITANHILIPESRVDDILSKTGVDPDNTKDGMTGSWTLDVMLDSSLHIENDLLEILKHYGYEEGREADQIAIGVNWGYLGSQLLENMDASTLLAGIAALALIIFTGYLIIYNIFRISVTGDIRFYGLLKTIGTTPKQMKRIIRYQALILSLCGIPLGLLFGYLTGALLTPIVISRLNAVVNMVSASPAIFIGAAVFSLVTVLLSCSKPGRIAAKVSPVEAVRYTEAVIKKKKRRTFGKKGSLFSMAWANLGRSPGKTSLTVLSLCLALVLLSVTVTYTGGFDMDKYLQNMTASDFIVANASYFQTTSVFFNEQSELPQDFIEEITARGNIKNLSRTYGKTSSAVEYVTEEWFRIMNGHWSSEEVVDQFVAMAERNEDGLLGNQVQLYGMEAGALDKLKVLEGDLSKIYEPGSHYIAAVYTSDDYGNPNMESNWAKVGDEVAIRYIDEYEYYDPVTGEVYGPDVNLDMIDSFGERVKRFHDETYTVAALVDVPYALGYRYYSTDEFVLNSEAFLHDSGTESIMYCAFDMTNEEAETEMGSWLHRRTEDTAFDYESKASRAEEFNGFRNMFLLLGSALSFIVGLVGVLNFFNTTMTGILSRQREFAVLQAVGMTGHQLKVMLVWEGILYTLGASLAALVFTIVFSPLIGRMFEKMFWFYTAKTVLWPVLVIIPVFAVLGCVIPFLMYGQLTKYSIVERLRNAE